MAQFHDYETYQWDNHQYQDNYFSNTYNFDWRDHPNVYDRYYENQGPSQIDPYQFDRLKEMFNNLIASHKEFMIENNKVRKNLRALNDELAMSSLRQYDELPIMPESNSREHDHAIAMQVKIVHEEQSWQVKQIKKESPEKKDESQKGQESNESQKKEGKSLTKECNFTKKEMYIPPQKGKCITLLLD